MKQTLLCLFLGVVAASLVGCVVSIGGRHESAPPPVIPPPPVVVTDPAQAATLAEIEAAARLSMDSGRLQTLEQLARRPDLSPPAQVHLVNVAYQRLSFDSSKLQILGQVIARPDFCDATRHAIVSQVHRLSFDSSRQTVLQQISQRLAAPHPQ